MKVHLSLQETIVPRAAFPLAHPLSRPWVRVSLAVEVATPSRAREDSEDGVDSSSREYKDSTRSMIQHWAFSPVQGLWQSADQQPPVP